MVVAELFLLIVPVTIIFFWEKDNNLYYVIEASHFKQCRIVHRSILFAMPMKYVFHDIQKKCHL